MLFHTPLQIVLQFYPVRAQCHFNVHTTSSQRFKQCIDVGITLCDAPLDLSLTKNQAKKFHIIQVINIHLINRHVVYTFSMPRIGRVMMYGKRKQN